MKIIKRNFLGQEKFVSILELNGFELNGMVEIIFIPDGKIVLLSKKPFDEERKRNVKRILFRHLCNEIIINKCLEHTDEEFLDIIAEHFERIQKETNDIFENLVDFVESLEKEEAKRDFEFLSHKDLSILSSRLDEMLNNNMKE